MPETREGPGLDDTDGIGKVEPVAKSNRHEDQSRNMTGTAVYGTVRTVVWEVGERKLSSYSIPQRETIRGDYAITALSCENLKSCFRLLRFIKNKILYNKKIHIGVDKAAVGIFGGTDNRLVFDIKAGIDENSVAG